ncbi:serine hydrolase family protein [Streptomyces fructofermentans]|uniref:Secreted protein n=1 Tax=Streptomyces fructofermentans TaxID=152141 RepID=A0A918NAP5_9ACTN|nr:hypothetical protein [Streptomyces fructofermentans]GGX56746.1 hypothetical protein GCM10010515_25290 [Streptomyces fructofermentans]
MSSKSSTPRRPGRRAMVAAGLVLAVGLGVSTQVSAQASVQAPAKASAAAQRTVSGTTGQAETRVADFYGAYIDAKGDYEAPDATLAKALRKHYLTTDFAERLALWEEQNGVDGVLRAQNVPAKWTVSDNGAAGNGREVVVTLTYGSGGTTQKIKLFVLVERYNRIADIATTTGR